jgi:hypothetical protein
METNACQGTCSGRIRIEVFCKDRACAPVRELTKAIADSVRWKGRVDLKVLDMSALEPDVIGGSACGQVVRVCGVHVIRNPDYQALVRALEDCAEFGDG